MRCSDNIDSFLCLITKFSNSVRYNDINSLYKLPKYSESVLSSLWERSSVNKRINTPLIQDNCDEHIPLPLLLIQVTPTAPFVHDAGHK